jgi:uncharacterized protein (DUF362 family)
MFAVMDGTIAGDGPGPRTMRPVIKDVMLASEDQVAIDTVASQMMGFDPMRCRTSSSPTGRGSATGGARTSRLFATRRCQRCLVGDNGASMVGDVMWFGPLKRFQKLFFHTPLVNLFVFGS